MGIGILSKVFLSGIRSLSVQVSEEDQQISLWIADLGNKDGKKVDTAKQALIKKGRAAVPALIDALSHTNKEVGIHAKDILVRIGPAAVPVLAKALTNKKNNYSVRGNAADVLTNIKPDAKDKDAVVLILDSVMQDRTQEYSVRRLTRIALDNIQKEGE